jgi:DNA-binding GntR family transcriptional regulator
MSDNQTERMEERRGGLVGRVSTSQAIVNELASEIINGTLVPGQLLREIELADRLGVSRQSLRAALAELSFRGLVRREPHRSVRVTVLTRRDAREIYAMRSIIEGEAIRRAASDQTTWPKIESAVKNLEQLPKGAPWSAIADGDVAFHRATVVAVGSPRLARAHAQLTDEMRLILVPARHYFSQPELVGEHRALFEIVRTGKPKAAFAGLKQHLELRTDELLRYLPDDDFTDGSHG